MRKVSVNLTEAQHTLLKKLAADTGLLQSEIIRRSLARTLAPETERPAARSVQPVLITSPVTLSPVLLARVNASPNFEKC